MNFVDTCQKLMHHT